MKPIRILYISPVAERGGAERALYNLLKFHNRKNCEPYVFFLKEGPFVREIRNLGIHVYIYDAGRLRQIWRYLQAIYEIVRFIQNNEIDIIHGNSSMGHIYGGLAALIARRRKVWFQHTCSQKFELIDQIATLIPSDAVITNSFFTASLQKKYFPYRKNIIVIYPGIDLSEFNSDTVKGKTVREKLGIKPAGRVVGIVGRIQRWKGHKYFIDAAYRVKKIIPDVKFLIVGDEMFNIETGYKNELLSMTKDLGLEDSIIFTGFHENVQDYIDAMDILVHASIHPEPFGFVICEGMVLGKTVIATDAGGPQEIITGPEMGYLYPPGNSLKLAELIINFLNNPEEMKAVGLKAEQRIREYFSMDKMIERVESLYEAIFYENKST